MTIRFPVTIVPGTRALFVSAAGGRIRELRLTDASGNAPHPLDPVSLIRFERWGALAFRGAANAHINATVLIDGENLLSIAIRHDIQPFGLTAWDHGTTYDRERLALLAEEIEDLSIDEEPSFDLARAARYFKELDEETSPPLYAHRCIVGDLAGVTCARDNAGSLTPAITMSARQLERDYRTSLIMGCVDVLWERLWIRYRNGQMPRIARLTQPQIAYLSALQLQVYRQCMGDFSPATAMQAYEAFACGDLHLALSNARDDNELFSNGTPNGPNVFCFAEFAFLAVDNKVHASEWLALLPGLLAAQEFYLYAFGDIDPATGRPRPQGLLSYGGIPRRQIPEHTRNEIIECYSKLTVEEFRPRCAANLRAAFEI